MAASKPAAVIDASIIISLIIPEESLSVPLQQLATAIKSNTIKLHAPTLIDYEVANTLKVAVIRHRFSASIARQYLDLYLQLTIHKSTPDFHLALKIAQKHSLSIYDATYLELAHRLQVPLHTLDKKLARLAPLKP